MLGLETAGRTVPSVVSWAAGPLLAKAVECCVSTFRVAFAVFGSAMIPCQVFPATPRASRLERLPHLRSTQTAEVSSQKSSSSSSSSSICSATRDLRGERTLALAQYRLAVEAEDFLGSRREAQSLLAHPFRSAH